MHITHVKISNILGIKELEFDAGQWNEFSGKNRQGKTSALDAIKTVLGKRGHDATIIHNGAKVGETVIVLDDDTVVKQRITPSSSIITVERDGKKVERPTDVLNALVDQLSVNPIAFLHQKKDRVNVLLQSLPIKIDPARIAEIAGAGVAIPALPTAFEQIATIRQKIYDERTGTNRAVKEKASTINQLAATLPPDEQAAAIGDDPTADLTAKMAEIDAARDAEMLRIDTKLESLRTTRDDNIRNVQASRDTLVGKFQAEIKSIEAEIAKIEASTADAVAAQNTSFAEMDGKAATHRAIQSAEFARQRTEATRALADFQSKVESRSRSAQTRATIALMEKDAEDLDATVKQQTAQIEGLDAYKSEILGSLPIDGLTVSDGEIFRHGVPFDRLNSEQQVGIAFEIATLRAGDLGVVCIDGIEQLDTEHYKIFTQRALDSGLQMFVTRVTDAPFAVNTLNQANRSMTDQQVALAGESMPAHMAALPWDERPTGLPAHVNAGTVLIEQERAIAEVKAKLTVARMNRRSTSFAHAEILRACGSIGFAEVAFYKYPRGGETISGPSIRMAEEIARCWGNFEYGLRELSQTGNASEMEAFAWDLETNMISSHRFTVQHIRDTKKGPKNLTDQRDIYELTANMGGRRLRARILAVMPKWLVEEATETARQTLLNGASMSPDDSRRKVISAFVKIGITPEQIATRIGHPIEALTPEEIVDLRGIFTSIRDGATKPSEWFDLGGDTASALEALGKAAPAPTAQAKPPATTKTAAEQKKAAAPPAETATSAAQPETPAATDAKPDTKPAATTKPDAEPEQQDAAEESPAASKKVESLF